MSTHMPGFQSFLALLRHFVSGKLANGSIKAKELFVEIDGLRPRGIKRSISPSLQP